MRDFTFLSQEQIFGKGKLDILKKYGIKCAITDFSILLGTYVEEDSYTSEGTTREYRTGWWWTSSPSQTDSVYIGGVYGDRDSHHADIRYGGARPAIPYSSIQSIASNRASVVNGVKEVEYGEYPQTIVDEHFSGTLEHAYRIGSLRTTGKKYTTDSIRFEDCEIGFVGRIHTEYEYQGNKYIRFVGDSNGDDSILSDGRIIKPGDIYWVHVEPIIWLVDERANIALAKKIIFSGVQFEGIRYYNGDFKNTVIKRFMDDYFSKEMISDRFCSQANLIEQTPIVKTDELGTLKNQNSVIKKENIELLKKQNFIMEKENIESLKKQNPYGFSFSSVTEEDIIRGMVESNVSVFLHGRSSEGKSARVKQIDPDCEIIYMRNATPDSLNGKSVYNAATGEMIDVPPTWYTKVKAKCEAEPTKIHIIFFDELTSALPSIQGMMLNIILDGEVNGKWKLPSNARIVAAGNDLNASLATNQMAEPLFNRFAHVYINTTVGSWLTWASTPKENYERLNYKEEEPEAKIHPSVYAYIAYKSYSGQDVLRTPYTGDKPNADPRKWEMASKILYKTKQPEMLRALIGEDLTRDFIAFTRQQVISVEDVINHNYLNKDLEMDMSQKL